MIPTTPPPIPYFLTGYLKQVPSYEVLIPSNTVKVWNPHDYEWFTLRRLYPSNSPQRGTVFAVNQEAFMEEDTHPYLRDFFLPPDCPRYHDGIYYSAGSPVEHRHHNMFYGVCFPDEPEWYYVSNPDTAWNKFILNQVPPTLTQHPHPSLLLS